MKDVILSSRSLLAEWAEILPRLAGGWRILSGVKVQLSFPVLTIILLMSCGGGMAWADAGSAVVKLDQAISNYDLTGHLMLFEDKTGLETIDSIQSKTFRLAREASPSLGFTRSVYWIKLALDNETGEPLTLVFEIANQFLDFVDLYVASNRTAHIQRYHGGARVPFDERGYQTRYPVIDLRFATHEQKTIFVRAQSKTPLRLPLVLSTQEAHRRADLTEYLSRGLFFGALIFLIIYNMFAWSILKQRAYLYYILTITGVGIWQLGFSGLVPRVTLFSRPETLLHLFVSGIALTCVFNIAFVSSFMDARAKYPIIYRILDIFLIVAMVNVILYVVNYYVGNPFAMVYGPILGWALAIIIGLMWYWGESHARYLFLAHAPLPILSVMFVGVMAGFIPFSFVLTELLKVGYLIQGMFFSLALADRYSMMQRHFREMLEDQVVERSAELVATNENLQSEIHERKRVEGAIAKAKREWEQTFDTVPDLIAIIDQNHVILRANKAMADKMKLHFRDVIGRHCYELCHGTSGPWHDCPLSKSLADGKEHSAELSVPTLGGTFLVSVTPLPTNDHQTNTFVHVARDITERKIFEEQLRKLAITDSLTNVWNRRHFMLLAERELDRAKRYGGQVALMMIDLDHFKAINDDYGHDVGDQTLKTVAQTCLTTLRKVDVFARYGGEEFAVALPETDLEHARQVAERLRHSVAETPMTDRIPPVYITLSIGVTVAGPDSTDLFTLLKHADTALYQAKKNGRNRVEIFGQR